MMGKLWLVTAGTGGSGVSSAALALAAAFARAGRRVLLADMAAGRPTQDYLTATDETLLYDAADAAAGRCALQDAWYRSPAYEGVWVLPAAREAQELPGLQAAALLAACARYFDEVVADCPPDAACLGELARQAAGAVLCVQAQPLARRQNARLREWLGPLCPGEVRTLVTRFDPTLLHGDARGLDGLIDEVGARLLGVVPQDRQFAHDLQTKNPQVRRTAAWQALCRCAARLRGEDIPLPDRLKG